MDKAVCLGNARERMSAAGFLKSVRGRMSAAVFPKRTRSRTMNVRPALCRRTLSGGNMTGRL